MLAKGLIGCLAKGNEADRCIRTMAPINKGDPAFAFLSLKNGKVPAALDYRTIRREMLEAACYATRDRFPSAEVVVGIASEPLACEPRSEDLVVLDAGEWTQEDQQRSKALQRSFFIRDTSTAEKLHSVEYEFPLQAPSVSRKGRNRNARCPCGSGRKYKGCCW